MLAWMDQEVDKNPDTQPWSSVEARRRFHFPEGPSGAAQENHPDISAAIDNAIANGDLALAGLLLHIYQDSFSHAGFGPILGHAWTIFPDIPYEDVDKTERMARATYNKLYNIAKALHVCCDLSKKSFDDVWAKMQGSILTKSWYEKTRVKAWIALGVSIYFVPGAGPGDPWVGVFNNAASQVPDTWDPPFENPPEWQNTPEQNVMY
jgi:hypothetical protein